MPIICRICAKAIFYKPIFNLFDQGNHKSLEQIKDVSGILLEKIKQIPQNTCEKCLRELWETHKFRKLIIGSQNFFKWAIDSLASHTITDKDQVHKIRYYTEEDRRGKTHTMYTINLEPKISAKYLCEFDDLDTSKEDDADEDDESDNAYYDSSDSDDFHPFSWERKMRKQKKSPLYSSQRVCRICAKHCSDIYCLVNMFDGEKHKYLQQAQDLCDITIERKENIPDCICKYCCSQLKAATTYRKLIIKSNDFFNAALNELKNCQKVSKSSEVDAKCVQVPIIKYYRENSQVKTKIVWKTQENEVVCRACTKTVKVKNSQNIFEKKNDGILSDISNLSGVVPTNIFKGQQNICLKCLESLRNANAIREQLAKADASL